MKVKIELIKLCGILSAQGKIIAINVYIWKEKRSKINKLKLHLRKLEKWSLTEEEKIEQKSMTLENRIIIEKINELKSLFF